MRAFVAVGVLASTVAIGSATSAAADPLRPSQWYLDAIHADAAHRVADGRGVTVAVVDTGVDAAHPDLAGQVVAGPDLVDGSGSDRDPNGHGTNVAGIIAALAGNGIGVEGAAPGARVLSIRVLDAQESGTTDDEARGIDAAVKAGAQVINLSLGPSPDVVRTADPTDPLGEAITRATAAGVVVVAAAGNYAAPLCAQPSNAQGLLCVGAVDRQLQRTDYSDYGVRVDVVAPGGDQNDGIESTAPGGGYGAMAGTSQAAPQAAAEAALLVQLGLRGQDVVTRIRQTAADLGAPGHDLDYGDGLIDLAAAVGTVSPTVSPSAAPPRLTGRAPTVATARELLRRGLRVRVRSTTSGRCRARLTLPGSTVLLRGTRTLRAGHSATLTLRVTRAGRRVLRRAGTRHTRLTIAAPSGRLVRTVRVRG